jgi:hypothetical protein
VEKIVGRFGDQGGQTLIPMMKFRLIKMQRLGWQPKQPGLIPDPERPKHFET